MITPKADFKNSPYAKGWQTLMDTRQFQEAVKVANMEMDLQNRGLGGDMGSAAALHYRKAGALQFLSILMNLTATEPKGPTKPADNLKHTV
jgi:hypothetical protein